MVNVRSLYYNESRGEMEAIWSYRKKGTGSRRQVGVLFSLIDAHFTDIFLF